MPAVPALPGAAGCALPGEAGRVRVNAVMPLRRLRRAGQDMGRDFDSLPVGRHPRPLASLRNLFEQASCGWPRVLGLVPANGPRG